MNYLKKYKDILILNYLLIIIYFAVFSYLNIEIAEYRMFSTVDSFTYRNASLEFYKFSEKGFSELRPFLYPLLLLITNKLLGVFGIWLIQFFFWIISINLVFLSIKSVTHNKTLSFIGGLIVATNISFIVLTTDALTESLSILLLSLLVYYLSHNLTKVNSIKTFHTCLLILVTLCVTKPIFYIHILFLLFVALPFFYIKQYIQKPVRLIVLLLCLAPLLYQISMMKIKYDTFSVSNIDSDSFRAYLLAQGVQHNNNIDLAAARAITRQMNTSQVVNYLMDNKLLYLKIYLQNLYNAIKSDPCFIMYRNSYYQPEAIAYMRVVNAFYFYTHIIFIFPVLIFIFLAFRKNDLRIYLLPAILICILSYYILLMTGFSFREGDRHGIISLPLWVFIYIVVANVLMKKMVHIRQPLNMDSFTAS